MDINITRAIIDAIHDGSLEKESYSNFEVFNFMIPDNCKGVDSNVLHPKKTWKDKEKFDSTLRHLATEFIENFKKFESGVNQETKNAGPTL